MQKTENQKLKLLYIKKYIEDMTDESHSVSANDIIDMLASYGITAERKSVYADIESLKDAGMNIINIKGRNGGYKLVSRTIDTTEIKILIDMVQSAKFITKKKSRNIIEKLTSLASVYEQKELKRHIFIADRIKNENESIYYSSDAVFSAINQNRQVSFKYYTYGANKHKKYHNGGKKITVSPYGMQFDDGKYYLIAYDTAADMIKHYRVDKMENTTIEDIPRVGKKQLANLNIADYSKKSIKMFSGPETAVTLQCNDEYAGRIIDKFGKQCKFFTKGNELYTTVINVGLSPTFYSWVFTYGGNIKIIAPQKAVDGYKEMVENAMKSI